MNPVAGYYVTYCPYDEEAKMCAAIWLTHRAPIDDIKGALEHFQSNVKNADKCYVTDMQRFILLLDDKKLSKGYKPIALKLGLKVTK